MGATTSLGLAGAPEHETPGAPVGRSPTTHTARRSARRLARRSRCTCTYRSASGSVRTATSWSTRAVRRGARQPRRGFVAALHVELDLRADALDADFGSRVCAAAARQRLPGGRHAVAAAGGGGGRAARARGAAVRHRGRRRDHARGEPRPGRAGRPRRLPRGGRTRVSLGAQSLDAAELRDSVAAIAPTTWSRRSRPRAAGFEDRRSTCSTTCRASRWRRWHATLERAIDLATDHLSTYALTLDDPDADGLTGPTGDHLPVRPGARPLAPRRRREQDEDRAADMDRGSTSASGRPASRGTRSPTGRGRATRAGTTWPTGDAWPPSASVRARTPSTVDGAGVERGPARWLSGRAHPRRHRPGRCSSTAAPARRRRGARRWRDPLETVSLALRTREGLNESIGSLPTGAGLDRLAPTRAHRGGWTSPTSDRPPAGGSLPVPWPSSSWLRRSPPTQRRPAGPSRSPGPPAVISRRGRSIRARLNLAQPLDRFEIEGVAEDPRDLRDSDLGIGADAAGDGCRRTAPRQSARAAVAADHAHDAVPHRDHFEGRLG